MQMKKRREEKKREEKRKKEKRAERSLCEIKKDWKVGMESDLRNI